MKRSGRRGDLTHRAATVVLLKQVFLNQHGKMQLFNNAYKLKNSNLRNQLLFKHFKTILINL